MGKNKLKHWAELETFERVFQPGHLVEALSGKLKGNWHQDVFKNNNPIVLELGCGRGEYTVNMGLRYPGKNFTGIDIKGARIWRGAKTAHESNLNNVAFLRTQIELLGYFFAPGEVSEIWITFPDPHHKRIRENKRLTSPVFLACYHTLLKPGGLLHLKTDSSSLFEYTREILCTQKGTLVFCSDNLYKESELPANMDIQTTYEKMFLDKGMTIKYLRFEFSK